MGLQAVLRSLAISCGLCTAVVHEESWTNIVRNTLQHAYPSFHLRTVSFLLFPLTKFPIVHVDLIHFNNLRASLSK